MAEQNGPDAGAGTPPAEKSQAPQGASPSSKGGVTLVLTAPAHQDAFVIPDEGKDGLRFDRKGTEVPGDKAEAYKERAAASGVTLSEKGEDQ